MLVPKNTVNQKQAVCIGVSAGGLHALDILLPPLVKGLTVPVIIVQHIGPDADSFMIEHFGSCCECKVREAEDKMSIEPGVIYFAPPNYHLLIENESCFALSVDDLVNYARPAIDELFTSASRVWGQSLVGIILTGANADGSAGLARIKKQGGLTIVQDPAEAENPQMPQAAIASGKVDKILPLKKITEFINKFGKSA